MTGKLEQQLAEARAREQQAVDELAKLKDYQDAIADKLERSGFWVVELQETVGQAKTFVVEEFKSSLDFLGVVEDAASKYFSDGFDFCKRQLRHHHPDFALT